MKIAISLLALVFAVAAQAQMAPRQSKQLECTGGANFRKFTATLDYSTHQAGSGYFTVRDANLMDGYSSARLHCVGNTLEDINCVGFLFETGSEVVKVTTSRINGDLTSSYRQLEGSIANQSGGPWACTIN